MLAAAQRLRRSSEFAVAVRCGRRAGRSTLVVHLQAADTNQPSPEQGNPPVRVGSAVSSAGSAAPKAGFVVSKAVGHAVVRNRVRRRLRHLVRDRLSALPPRSTLVVRALPAAATAPYVKLAADLDAALAAAQAPRKSNGRSR